jgi:hypothetical protein
MKPLTEKQENEIEALQNFATNLGLSVYVRYSEDERKKHTYFLTLNGISISPCLDYSNLNHFMLGWNNCLKHQN